MRLLGPVSTLLLMLFATSVIAQLPKTACFEVELDNFATSDDFRHLVEITAPALGGEAGDFLSLEFYGSNHIGSFELGAGDNANYSSCLQCILAYVDDGSGPFFFQATGSLTVYGDPTNSVLDAELSDVTLMEVTIDPETYVSTLVPGGDCLHILTASLVTDSLIFNDGFE